MHITTIGDGAMASVCSAILAAKGHDVTMWVRLSEHLKAFQEQRRNVRYLPELKFPEKLHLTDDDARAFADCELVLCAVPTQYMRTVLTRLKGHIPPNLPVVSVIKGIENGTLLRPTQIIQEILGSAHVVALSGPNIATEMARRLPATAVVASDKELGHVVTDLFTTPYFRVYRNDDLVGVEVAGALKNVIAVAAGILDGIRAGNNAKAALLTRGLVEITRLGEVLGAHPETFAGLAGLGDLVTTCFSPEGRNRGFGERIGKGEKPEEVLKSMVGVVEGVATTRSVVEISRRHNIEMPISQGLYEVLFEGKKPAEGVAELMSREPKHEWD